MYSGIDSLSVRISRRRHASQWIAAAAERWLAIWSDGADLARRKSYFERLGGLGSFQLRRSRNPYAWSLSNPQVGEVRIWNPAKWASANRDQTGHVMIDFRSVFLLREGLAGVRRVIDAVVSLVYGRELDAADRGFTFERIRRVDLARDVQMPNGWQLDWSELPNFVTRSKYSEQWPGLPELDDDQAHAAELDALHVGPCPTCGHVGREPFRWRVPRRGTAPALWPERVCEHQATWGAPEDNKAPQTSHHPHEPSGSCVAAPSGGTVEPDVWRVVGLDSIKTCYFSKFSAPLHGRLYDKLGSLNVQNKGYMRGVWAGNGWDGDSPVWRTEFCLSGHFLRGIVDPDSGAVEDVRELSRFQELAGAIWAYLTRSWLRHMTPHGDRSHVTRWKPSAWWTSIQQSWDGSAYLPARRLRVLDLPDPRALLVQAQGCLAAAAAMEADDDRHVGALERIAALVVEWSESDEAVDRQAAVRVARGIDAFTRFAEHGKVLLTSPGQALRLLTAEADGEPPPGFDPDDPTTAQLDRWSMMRDYGGS